MPRVKQYLVIALILSVALFLSARCSKQESPQGTQSVGNAEAGEAASLEKKSDVVRQAEAAEASEERALQNPSSLKNNHAEDQKRKETERPELIVLITVDSLRADYLGCYGRKDIKTPAIDGLAGDGILFEKCITPVPQDLPAHVAIMTGRYPEKNGVFENAVFKLPEGAPTLASLLKKKGYSTAAFIGSAVLDKRFGLSQGFDLYSDGFESLLTNTPSLFSEKKAQDVIGQVKDYLENTWDKKNLFLWVHLNDPHHDFSPPDPYEKSYKGEVEYADSQLGELITSLKKAKKYGSSAIVMTSDHGMSLGQFSERYYGVNLYEPTIRVPLIVKLPDGAGKKEKRVPGLVGLIDIAPTIMLLAGVERDLPAFDGRNILQSSSDEEKGREEGKQRYFASSYHQFLAYGWNILRAVEDDDWKYIQGRGEQLFKMSEGSSEITNLLEGNKKEAEKLSRSIDDFVKGLRSLKFTANRPAHDFRIVRNLSHFGYIWCPPESFAALAATGDSESRLRRFEKLSEIEDSIALVHTAIVNRNPRNASKEMRTILTADPENYCALAFLTSANVFAQRTKNATELVPIFEQAYPDRAEPVHMRGHMDIIAKEYEKALQAFLKVLAIDPIDSEVMYDVACMYSLLDKKEESLNWLEKSILSGYDDFQHMEQDSDLTNVRDLPRYKEIMKRSVDSGASIQ